MTTFTETEQAANREKWIAALRSGEYEQTNGELRSDDGRGDFAYCCLGVACDLAVKEGIGTWADDNSWVQGSDLFDVVKEDSHLPPPVRDWLGLRTMDGAFEWAVTVDDHDYTNLIMLNDDAGCSFEQIAKIIERAPEGLIAVKEIT